MGPFLEIVRLIDTGVGLGWVNPEAFSHWPGAGISKWWACCICLGGHGETTEAWKQPTCSHTCGIVLRGVADGGSYFATCWSCLHRPKK